MGACMSSNNEEADQKKKSQAIDKQLEEDSKRLRKECKILLLGTSTGKHGRLLPHLRGAPNASSPVPPAAPEGIGYSKQDTTEGAGTARRNKTADPHLEQAPERVASQPLSSR